MLYFGGHVQYAALGALNLGSFMVLVFSGRGVGFSVGAR